MRMNSLITAILITRKNKIIKEETVVYDDPVVYTGQKISDNPKPIKEIETELQPVDPEELQKVITKLKNIIDKNDSVAHIDLLLENIRKKVDNFKRIALSNADGIHLFDVSDIIRCESEDNYTKFFIKNNKPILISKTLKEYEELLTEHGFERIHQSHLINIAYLKSYIKKDGGYVIMADNSNLPISQRKKDRLQEILKTM